MLLTVDLHKDFIDEKGIAVATVLSFQTARIKGSELDAPKTDCFATDCDATFGQEVFNVAVAEVESIVKPDSVGNDVRRKSVAFLDIHPPILAISSG
jgi:hypothetical protein